MAVSLRELWCASDARSDDRSARWPARGDSGVGARPPDTRDTDTLPVSDAALVARIREGDESAFDIVFRAEFSRLVGFVTALLGSSDTAQDVAAEVFTRLWRRRYEWKPRGSIASYLFRAARNQAANVRRGERRADVMRHAADRPATPGMSAVPPSADTEVEREELRARVWGIIDAMPPQRRAVAYLRWREGMEYEEIAEISGQSVTAVRMQVSRTLTALREVIPGLID